MAEQKGCCKWSETEIAFTGKKRKANVGLFIRPEDTRKDRKQRTIDEDFVKDKIVVRKVKLLLLAA